MEDLTEVKIPLSLYRAIEDKIKDGGFLSVSDFVTYAARKVLSEIEGTRDVIPEEEKEKIKERLKALGYI